MNTRFPLLILLLIFNLFCTNIKAQYFEPLQAEPFQEDIITDVILSSDSAFVFSTMRYGNLYNQYNNNFSDVYNNDTVIIDITKYNLYTKVKTRIGFKKPTIDSLIYCKSLNLYIDKNKKNICMSYYQMPDALFAAPVPAIEFFKNKHIKILDNNLNITTDYYIPFDGKKIHQNAQPVLMNDTMLTEIIVDAQNNRNGLLTTNILNNYHLDSIALNDTAEFILNINLLNDTTIVALENTAIQYFSTQNDSLGKVLLNIPPNILPGPMKDPFLNNSDTTYYYHSRQMFPNVSPQIGQLDIIRGRDGKRLIIKKVYHDSVYNATSLHVVESDYNNYNMLYQNSRYATAAITDYMDTTDNVVVVMKFNASDTLLWKKYAGFDARYYEPKILATPDSGCIVFANRIDHAVQPIQRDLYYIKFDKDGNQEYNYLATAVSNLQVKTITKPMIYPNPSSDIIAFNYPVEGSIVVQFFTMDGKLATTANSKFNSPIKVTDLPPGIYTWKIDHAKKIFSGLFVKE